MTELRIPIPNGYEPDGPWPECLRIPEVGVPFLSVSGNGDQVATAFAPLETCRIVLRKTFDPAEWWARHPWILAEWIAMDGGTGVWVAHQSDPQIVSASYWDSKDDSSILNGDGLFDFDPPPITDWRQSKMRNPRCV